MSDIKTDLQVKLEVAQVIEDLEAEVGKPLSDAVVGFIEKNRIVGKTAEEIGVLVSSAESLGGPLKGEGDRFKGWCEKMGRPIPSEELVSQMNRDPFDAGIAVKAAIPKEPLIYRAYCSYIAGRGRRRV